MKFSFQLFSFFCGSVFFFTTIPSDSSTSRISSLPTIPTEFPQEIWEHIFSFLPHTFIGGTYKGTGIQEFLILGEVSSAFYRVITTLLLRDNHTICKCASRSKESQAWLNHVPLSLSAEYRTFCAAQEIIGIYTRLAQEVEDTHVFDKLSIRFHSSNTSTEEGIRLGFNGVGQCVLYTPWRCLRTSGFIGKKSPSPKLVAAFNTLLCNQITLSRYHAFPLAFIPHCPHTTHLQNCVEDMVLIPYNPHKREVLHPNSSPYLFTPGTSESSYEVLKVGSMVCSPLKTVSHSTPEENNYLWNVFKKYYQAEQLSHSPPSTLH